MSWGYKILTFYLAFVALIVFMVFSAFQYKVNLVSTDYYERELNYQDVIDGHKNLAAAGETVYVNHPSGGLDILLPNMAAGKPYEKLEIWLYNEATQEGDIKINIDNTSDNRFELPLETQNTGSYVLKVKWYQDGVPYYYEKTMRLN